jgi:hypothetical protein
MSITQELVKELFEYKDGQLFWKKTTSKRSIAGNLAGYLTKRGYWRVSINYKHYYTHRIVFLMFHGHLPKLLDHIDGNPLNNKIENLRAATSAENVRNSKLRNTNKSGIKGVCWDKQHKKWSVTIMVSGKNYRIGRFKDLELAQLAIEEARNKYHKEFANHG